jgi:hypothetical protein
MSAGAVKTPDSQKNLREENSSRFFMPGNDFSAAGTTFSAHAL